jgi:hypothetical protein
MTLLSAQSVTEVVLPMSKGENNAFQATLPKISTKDAGKAWKDFMKDYKGKPKYDKKTGEWFSDDAKIEDMSENYVDVYATFAESGDNTNMTIWYNLGGAYLSSELHAEKVPLVDEMVNRFIYTSEDMAGEMVKLAESQLSDLESNLKDLENNEADYKKEIEAAKAAIAQAEKNIKDSKVQQATVKEEIKVKETQVKEIKEKISMAKKKK